MLLLLLFLCFFLGMLTGSSPLSYPSMSRAWGWIGMNISQIRPIARPKAGVDFEFDATSKVIKPLKTERGLILSDANGTRFVITQETADLSDGAVVYFQDIDDGRTSAEVQLK